ncbi:unnamed protein product [Hydatigera taeniaeformis]|uniref:PINc domain-containing protein n=1 Tax=Hydatigena taeniaeformis TaxID=6205 RepID=A0A0R3X349_HYDTA|nr:unnamed protein product [Hydatigera taeniaeformis]
MGLRIGARRRKDKQNEDKRTRKSSNSKSADRLDALPPASPGSLTTRAVDGGTCLASPFLPNSISTATSNNLYNAQSTSNRNVIFRDNRFPDGTIMPRIQTQQSQILPVGGGKEGRVSPTGSVYSSASVQPALLNYASYPPSYVPQFSAKPTELAVRRGEHINGDSVYQSVYAEAMPKPDYPLSNDGTATSNRDSGLDTESRSSSAGKPPFTNTVDKCSRWREASRQDDYRQPKGFQSRHLSQGRPNSVYTFNDSPQILLPRNYQSDCDTPEFGKAAIATSSRGRRQLNSNDIAYGTAMMPRQWRNPKSYDEKSYSTHQTDGYYRCSSALLNENIRKTSLGTGSLQRIQLEDDVSTARGSRGTNYGHPRRRFRREDEFQGCTVRSASYGLPRNQPIRGGYFEEKNEMDRYGRLSPVRRPISRTCNSRDVWDFDNGGDDYVDDDDDDDDVGSRARVEVDYSEEDEEEDEEDGEDEETSNFQDAPYTSKYSRAYANHSRMGPNYYRRFSVPSMANHEVSIIRL